LIEKKTSRAISRKIRDLRKPKVQNKAKRGKNASGKKRVHGRAPISGTARPASDLARPGRAMWHDCARWHGLPVPLGMAVPRLVRVGCAGVRFFGFLMPFRLTFWGTSPELLREFS